MRPGTFHEMDTKDEGGIAETFESGIYHPLVPQAMSVFAVAAALGMYRPAAILGGHRAQGNMGEMSLE